MASEGALVSNETVMLAYKCGRDMTILTSRRMLFVDTKGISGKRVSNVVLWHNQNIFTTLHTRMNKF